MHQSVACAGAAATCLFVLQGAIAQIAPPIDLLALPAAASATASSQPAPLSREFLQVLPPTRTTSGVDGSPANELRLRFGSIPTSPVDRSSAVGLVRSVVMPATGTYVLHGQLDTADRG